MASKAKKTTMAKLAREAKVRMKQHDKQLRKEARKLAAAQGPVDLEQGVEYNEFEETPVPTAADA